MPPGLRQRLPGGIPPDHVRALLASGRDFLAEWRDRLGPAGAGASRSGHFAATPSNMGVAGGTTACWAMRETPVALCHG